MSARNNLNKFAVFGKIVDTTDPNWDGTITGPVKTSVVPTGTVGFIIRSVYANTSFDMITLLQCDDLSPVPFCAAKLDVSIPNSFISTDAKFLNGGVLASNSLVVKLLNVELNSIITSVQDDDEIGFILEWVQAPPA
jgi:hypothetical protein